MNKLNSLMMILLTFC